MDIAFALGSLKIESDSIKPDSPNYTLKDWPPADDFPIVMDAQGKVISLYGDSVWDITPWSGRIRSLNFGDGRRRKNDPGISPENSALFRQTVAWLLYRPGKVISARTLYSKFTTLRVFFVFCSLSKINASDICRFPILLEKLPTVIARGGRKNFISTMHSIWESRKSLGFSLLDNIALSQFAGQIVKHEKAQTAYIPPRIWLYQISQLKSCIDDFLAHSAQIEACFRFMLDAYSHNAGSLENACSKQLPAHRRPFNKKNHILSGKTSGCIFHGTFTDTLEKFGLNSLFDRWMNDVEKNGAAAMSAYFTFISMVCTAYIVNFSLMRIDEAYSLRSDCLRIEKDDMTGESIYILQGVTTKTVQDDDARWITSPSTEIAVNALRLISSLRNIAAIANPDVPTIEEDLRNPYLLLRPYEPWRRKSDYIGQNLDVRPAIPSFNTCIGSNKKLFDESSISLTGADLATALLVTPSLDPERYAIGKPWPLSWHQMRRTGVVNIVSSGLVTDAAVQYQLKHVTRAMTRYYGNGHLHMRSKFNEAANAEYVRTMYEVVALELSMLSTSRFMSPHGEKRKEQMLSIISDKDHKALIGEAQRGTIDYRPTFCGVCTNPHPCPFGGWDNVARCAGADGRPACNDALFDMNSLPRIRSLGEVLRKRLASAQPNSPLEESLKMQVKAVENIINVIAI
ncbi:hypothetical protein H8F21_13420 [Pseudomonas sp. P66]|uniref:Integrase n=1 Tax=Pseudomonas arcuscaelestis TaxID=2710591 RepID=A0ABS2BY73_9PSED|nr:hypothetical protein [Pseudomonas arcuscaelestis]MBM5458563.1 hypothetical protein [Pseudomonas arcuscaelestis]